MDPSSSAAAGEEWGGWEYLFWDLSILGTGQAVYLREEATDC